MSGHLEFVGEVISVDKGGFRVRPEGADAGVTIYARLGGKMRKHRIRVLLGDVVTVKVSAYDMTHGFITLRH